MSSKWTSEAGPRQTKQVEELMRRLSGLGRTTRELYGVIGVDEHSSCMMNVFGPTSEACNEALARVGEKFAWTITRENHKEVIGAFQFEIDAFEVPTIDKRITPEQDSERKAKWADEDAKRKEEAAAKSAEKDRIAAELQTKYPWAAKNDKLSTHARAAANLRTELAKEFPGVKFSVRSETYSGGNSINVDWTNGPTEEQVKEITGKYTYGCFHGYDDSYEYDHSAEGDAVGEVLGRVRHLHTHRNISPEIVAKGRELICAQYGVTDDPTKQPWEIYLDEAHYNSLSARWHELIGKQAIAKGAELTGIEWVDDEGHRLVFSVPERAAGDEAPAAVEGSACHVEKHFHTKKGFDFWIVVLDDRVERGEFESIRDDCKRAGGWYSRQWGKTPGGFAFEDETSAVAFANELNSKVAV